MSNQEKENKLMQYLKLSRLNREFAQLQNLLDEIDLFLL